MQQAPQMNLIAPDIAAQQMALQRQQQMADLLRQQAATPIDGNQVVSGRAVPISPVQGIAKLLQAYIGQKSQDDIDQKSLDMSKQYQNRLSDILDPNQTTLPPDQTGPSVGPADAAKLAAALRREAGPEMDVQQQNMPVLQQDQQGPTMGEESAASLASALRGGAKPQAMRPLPIQQPQGDKRFGIASLLRGNVIGQIGGDKAAASYYKDQELPDSVRANNYYGLSQAEVADTMRREAALKGQQVMPQGNTITRTDANGQIKPVFSAADIEKGQITYDANGAPSVRQLPGAAAAISSAAAAKKAGENMQTLATPEQSETRPNGQIVPRTIADTIANGGTSGAASVPPSSGGLPQNYIDAVISTESGGNPNAVSPKGAQGTMQVMPKTAAKPGLGVTPAKNNSPLELERLGKEYLLELNNKYGDKTIAAIAYNMGLRKTDKWLESGGDFSKLPSETKNYVASVMTKSAVNARNQPPQRVSIGVGPVYGQKGFAESVASGAGAELIKTKEKIIEASNSLYSIQASQNAIADGAFLGSGAELKTKVSKFIKGAFGVDVAPEKTTNTDYLQSKLGDILLGSSQALGRQATDDDAKRISEIIGTVSKDPAALSKLLDFRRDMILRAINTHNVNVKTAERKGLTSPYDLSVGIPHSALGRYFELIDDTGTWNNQRRPTPDINRAETSKERPSAAPSTGYAQPPSINDLLKQYGGK